MPWGIHPIAFRGIIIIIKKSEETRAEEERSIFRVDAR
jgi:hypothetical protein